MERCEKRGNALVADLARQREAAVTRLQAANERASVLVRAALELPTDSPSDPGDEIEKLEARERHLALAVEEWRGNVVAAQERVAQERGRADRARAAARYDEVVRVGRETAARVLAEDDAAAKRADVEGFNVTITNATATVQTETAKARQHLQIANGRFDGTCPLVGEPCAAKSFVEDRRASAAALARDATAKATAATTAVQGVMRDRDVVAQALMVSGQNAIRLDQLRQEARSLKPQRDAYVAEPGGEIDGTSQMALDSARNEEANAIRAHAGIKSTIAEVTRLRAEAIEYREKATAYEVDMTATRAAVAVVGKGGAQRRVAERALSRIEAGANALLQRSGIPLQIGTRWSREIDGLEAACSACGTAYPASQKVKECPRCGATRQQKRENKLQVVMSRRSGAAEDLGGIAFQLSASAWLRARRHAAWSVAMIDEPFGSIDVALNRMLAGRLVGMLRSDYGFEQAMIISHTRGVSDAMPGRIEVESDGRWSTAKVVT